MKIKIKAILLWFTAGIAGFFLGFLFGRATAKRIYILPPHQEDAIAKRHLRFVLLRTAIIGITCGLGIFCGLYFTHQPQESPEIISENRNDEGGNGMREFPPFSNHDLLMYPTYPPKFVSPKTNEFTPLGSGQLPTPGLLNERFPQNQ